MDKLTPQEQAELDALNSGLSPEEQAELDALNGVPPKKKDLPASPFSLDQSGNVSPEDLNQLAKGVLAKNADDRSKLVKRIDQYKAGVNPVEKKKKDDEDVKFLDNYYKQKPPKEEDPLSPIDPNEYRKMGYSEEDIKTLLEEEKLALSEDSNFYKKVAESTRSTGQDRTDPIGFLKAYKRKSGEDISSDIQKAHAEVDKSTPEALKKYEDDVWNNGPDFVPLNTPTGAKIYEEAISKQSEVINKALTSLYSNPEVKRNLDRMEEISAALSSAKPSTPEDIAAYNQMVDEHTKLRQDPNVGKILSLTKRVDDLVGLEKEMYSYFPDVFKDRAEKAVKQKGIDEMFKANQDPRLPFVSQFGRGVIDFVGNALKFPSTLDTNDTYGPLDKWGDFVDKTVDGVNDDLFAIPSWYDPEKAQATRAAISADYQKKIDGAKPEEKEALQKSMDADLERIGTGALTYTDEAGNRVWRTDLLLPKTARMLGDMAPLMLGGAVGGSTGLFAASYVSTADNYREAALQAGMSPAEATAFAHSSAALTSSLELISPQKYLWNRSEIAERVAKGLKSGQGIKSATKEAFKFFGKELGKEQAQEFSQLVGDKVTEWAANKATGKDRFKQNIVKTDEGHILSDAAKDEALETMVLTAIVAGAPSGPVAAANVLGRNSMYSDAIQIAAENKQKFLPFIKEELKAIGADPVYAKKVMDDIASVEVPDGKPMYKINGQVVDRDVVESAVDSGIVDGVMIANDPELEGKISLAVQGKEEPKTQPSAVVFFSPSERERSTFDEAIEGLSSKQHKALGKASSELTKALEMDSKDEAAIGGWKDGAEESFYSETTDPDRSKAKYKAAVLGIAAKQKSVGFFDVGNGPDMLHTATVKAPIEEVRDALLESGLEYHTLVPTKEGTRVEIVDQGAQEINKVSSFVKKLNGRFSSRQGTADFIGGDTRAAGRTAMEAFVNEYEALHPEKAGTAQRVIEGYVNNTAEPQKEKVEPKKDPIIDAVEQSKLSEIKSAIKTQPKLNFVPDSQILNLPDPRGMRRDQASIKKEFENLKLLMQCLSK